MLLFDGGKEILANFGDDLSAKAAKELRRLGVQIHCGSVVTGLDAFGADVKGPDGTVERVAARTKVWAAGVQASPLAGCWPRDLVPSATGRDASPCSRTARCPAIPRCSRSAT